MKQKIYHSATILGTTIEEKVANAFRQKCYPYTANDIINAFIYSVVNGELTITNSKED